MIHVGDEIIIIWSRDQNFIGKVGEIVKIAHDNFLTCFDDYILLYKNEFTFYFDNENNFGSKYKMFYRNNNLRYLISECK